MQQGKLNLYRWGSWNFRHWKGNTVPSFFLHSGQDSSKFKSHLWEQPCRTEKKLLNSLFYATENATTDFSTTLHPIVCQCVSSDWVCQILLSSVFCHGSSAGFQLPASLGSLRLPSSYCSVNSFQLKYSPPHAPLVLLSAFICWIGIDTDVV